MAKADDGVKVERSGHLYLVARGEVGRLYDDSDAADGWAGGVANVQSILAHCNAQDPWEPVDRADWPLAVAKIARTLPDRVPDGSEA